MPQRRLGVYSGIGVQDPVVYERLALGQALGAPERHGRSRTFALIPCSSNSSAAKGSFQVA
jgi:hypothetical protein